MSVVFDTPMTVASTPATWQFPRGKTATIGRVTGSRREEIAAKEGPHGYVAHVLNGRCPSHKEPSK
jgi:hypothetical protein